MQQCAIAAGWVVSQLAAYFVYRSEVIFGPAPVCCVLLYNAKAPQYALFWRGCFLIAVAWHSEQFFCTLHKLVLAIWVKSIQSSQNIGLR